MASYLHTTTDYLLDHELDQESLELEEKHMMLFRRLNDDQKESIRIQIDIYDSKNKKNAEKWYKARNKKGKQK
jgi:hypothetical protein